MYHTYHCICTELIIAVSTELKELPQRQKDASHICSLNGQSSHPCELVNVTIAPSATVLKLEDGFEKRYAVSCARCDLTVGYQLDVGSFPGEPATAGRKEEVVYILPGGLMSTEEMQSGKNVEKDIKLVADSVR